MTVRGTVTSHVGQETGEDPRLKRGSLGPGDGAYRRLGELLDRRVLRALRFTELVGENAQLVISHARAEDVVLAHGGRL